MTLSRVTGPEIVLYSNEDNISGACILNAIEKI